MEPSNSGNFTFSVRVRISYSPLRHADRAHIGALARILSVWANDVPCEPVEWILRGQQLELQLRGGRVFILCAPEAPERNSIFIVKVVSCWFAASDEHSSGYLVPNLVSLGEIRRLAAICCAAALRFRITARETPFGRPLRLGRRPKEWE